tara:strand:- start:906 stop:1202 length:297 start_codon:yes stop_codon:yes gene_type:complete
MEGFTDQGDPVELSFTTMMTLGSDGELTSVHRIPDEQFVHTCDEDAKCICGPHVIINVMQMGPLPMVQHQPLYKAYYDDYDADEPGIDIPYFDLDDED